MANDIYRGYEYGPSTNHLGAWCVFRNGQNVKDNLAHGEHCMDWIDGDVKRRREEENGK